MSLPLIQEESKHESLIVKSLNLLQEDRAEELKAINCAAGANHE